jgi:hypothetical protein
MNTARTHAHRGPDHVRHTLIWLGVLPLVAVIALLIQQNLFQNNDSPSKGSGVAATATRHVGPFSGVDLAGSNDVMIRVGATQTVTVHGDDNLLRLVTTEVRGDQLVIDNSDSFSTVAPMGVAVTVPTLDAISLSGLGRVTVSGIDTNLLTVAIDGLGAIFARGRANAVDATLNGSGNVELRRLVAHDAHAIVAGSGQIWVYATNSLTASVPGTGTVLYSGDPPHVTESVSGTGAVVAK